MGGIARKLIIAGAGLCVAGSLSACGALKSALGMEKKPPDEFAVVTKAPLVIPPDFSLRPPRPGAQDSQQLTPSQAAEQTVFGKVVSQEAPTADQSRGEYALLQAAGADRADGSIRGMVAADAAAASKDRSLTDRLMFWKDGTPEGVAVDASAEQGRIRQSEAEGRTPVEGAAQEVQKASASESKSGGGFLSKLWPF